MTKAHLLNEMEKEFWSRQASCHFKLFSKESLFDSIDLHFRYNVHCFLNSRVTQEIEKSSETNDVLPVAVERTVTREKIKL